jgi:hypothetical protein
MKKSIVVLSALLFSSSALSQQTVSSFKNNEYYRSRALDSVKAADAWSRGYTGKGVTIAILDSGINSTSNVEFLGRIKLAKDFTGQNNIVDTLGHGTAVAGVAAAARNGSGMVGVAPDANLIIGKITTTGLTTGNIIVQALNWASTNNAKVINLSFNSALASTAINAQLVSPGVYRTRFTNSGGIPTINPYTYADAMKGDSVLVIAAGNNGTPWSGTYSQLATATDKNGNLIMGGKVIVAGNWNSQTNTSTGPSNNGAAHLCQYMVGTICQDKYQMWQFYLLAPGTGITTTGIRSTGLSTQSGTSMAAPTVSGAAAIVRQMWPQLNAANTVQVLLQSANKNIPGYNKYLHGQGLLDLEKATRPLGTIVIPAGVNFDGPQHDGLKPMIITGGSASTAGAQSLMVLDEFDRDFYLPGKMLTAHYTAEEADIVQTALPYFTGNAYTQFNQYNDYMTVRTGSAASTWYFNSGGKTNSSPAMGEISYTTNSAYGDVKVTTGMMIERSAWLGNYVNGFNDKRVNKDSVTQYVGVNLEQNYKDIKVSVGVTNGITSTDSHSDNIRNIGPILSYSWNVNIEKKIGEGAIGVMTYQPVSVYHAEADLVAPVGLTENFDVIQNSKANLAADVRELRSGAYYKVNNFRDTNLMTFVEYRKDYRGQSGVDDIAVGIVFTKKF